MALTDALSAARFRTYLGWAGQDQQVALRLYTYNTQLSAALYGPIHMLEVALRNIADNALVQAYGAAWLDGQAMRLTKYQTDAIKTAIDTLARQHKAIGRDGIIAELSFGFWTSLFGPRSNHLWQYLRPVFHTSGLQRSTIAQELSDLRDLRNRMAHHEPIVQLQLDDLYRRICKMTGWLDAEAAAWIRRYSTWPSVYAGVRALMRAPTTGVRTIDPAVVPRLPR